jgi:hypothetical protein
MSIDVSRRPGAGSKEKRAGGTEKEMDTNSTRKIVINRSFGEFCLSHRAFLRLRELGQREALQEPDRGTWPSGATPQEASLNRCGVLIPRDDRSLVQVVEELGAEANGHCAELKIVAIPTEIQWEIKHAGGVEHVSEVHRTWS